MRSLIIETMIRARDVALDSSSRFPIARWAPLPLRLIVGFGFMQHGFSKLSRGSDAFVAILHALGVPAPHFMAWCTILIELLGGLAVMLGAFVSLVSVPMAALLLVAIFTVHLPYGFSSIKLMAVTPAGAQFGPVGYECNLLYLACLAALALGGSGPLGIEKSRPLTEGEWVYRQLHGLEAWFRSTQNPSKTDVLRTV
jgi:putative oxidoreductase